MDIDKAINHLQKVDSRMKTLIKKYGHPKFSPIDNYFEALIKSIVSQQISTKAASAIYNRFKTLFNGNRFPNPKNPVPPPPPRPSFLMPKILAKIRQIYSMNRLFIE